MALEEILFDSETGLSTIGMLALLNEFARGEITIVQLKSQMAQANGKAFTQDQLTDIDGIETNMNGKETVSEKLAIAQEIFDVFVLSQSANSIYETPQSIKNRLGFI